MPIELCNGFYAPDGRPTGFEWDFAGDVTGGIAAQPDDDPGINPWAWMNIHFGSSVNPTTVTYDSVNDVTRVLESGDPLPAVPASYTPWALDIYNNPTYHTGIYQSAPQADLVSAHWVYPFEKVTDFGGFSIHWNGTFTKKTKATAWMLTYVSTLDAATHLYQSGHWQVTGYDPTNPKTFSLVNTGMQPLLIDSIGYIADVASPTDPDCVENPTCEADKAMLDSLNGDFYPPPGADGSSFIELKAPDKAIPHGGTLKLKIK